MKLDTEVRKERYKHKDTVIDTEIKNIYRFRSYRTRYRTKSVREESYCSAKMHLKTKRYRNTVSDTDKEVQNQVDKTL